MRIKYSPDADVLLIQLREGKSCDSIDIAEGIIVHLSEESKPVEIEILDASKLVEMDSFDITLREKAIA